MTDDLHQRARAVFLDLSTLDGPVASGELDRLVGDDAALRAAVVSLLDARLNANDAGLMTDETWSQLSARITESAGTIIGPYKILQRIGEGGFGSVFLAEQSEPVRRRVALKIIKLGMDTKQVIARFEAERQALALMDHPHIARVFDAGSTKSGRPYFAMEYVVGDAITKFADAYKLDIEARLRLLSQVCSAVQHAHTKGVIHRDLKPANVLVSMVDGKPFAKVIDFGIAKATASPLTHKTLFTEHRQLIGTPEYMSPEQADGSPDIDTRTDVYALGVLLYELLTGATPFDAARLRSAAWNEMQRIIREEEPPLPSLRLSRDVKSLAKTAAARSIEPPKLSPTIRGELDWIVMKALDKDRGRRYTTPLELAEDIKHHLNGDAVEAAPPSTGYKLRKFLRRNKGPAITAAAVAAVLMLGLAGTSWQWMKYKGLHNRAYITLGYVDAKLAGKAESLTQEEWRQVEINWRDTTTSNGTSAHQAIATLANLAIDQRDQALDASHKLERTYAALQQQTDLATTTLSDMFLLGTGTPGGMDAGLPRFPEIRGEPGTTLSARLIEKNGQHAFDFWKRNEDGTVYEPLEPEKVLPALADTAMLTLDHSLKIADNAEWSAYTANLALSQSAMEAGDWPAARRYVAECPESKRGWEWTFMQGHAKSVAAEYPYSHIAVSPDGSKVISVMGQLVTVSTADGVPITDYRLDYLGQYDDSMFSTDGSTAVLRIDEAWTRTGEPLGRGRRAVVLSTSVDVDESPLELPGVPTAVSSDGSKVAVVDQEGTKIYSRDGSLLRSKAPEDGVIRYSDYTRFVGGDTVIADLAYNAEGSLSLWSLDTGEVKFLTPASGGAGHLSSSPDGQYIAAGLTNGIAVWDTKGQLVFESNRRGHYPKEIAWSEDGSVLVTLSSSGPTFVWSIDGTLLATVPNEANERPTIGISDNGSSVAFAWFNGIRFVNTRTGETSFIDANNAHTTERAYSGNASWLVYVGNDTIQTVKPDGELVEEGSIYYPFQYIYAISHEAAFVGHGESSGLAVVRFPLRHTRHRVRWDPERCAVYAAAILGDNGVRTSREVTLPDGSRTISADRRTLRFTDTTTDRTVLTLPLELEVASLALSPEADRLVITFVDGTLEVLDTRPVEVQMAAIAEENDRRDRVRPIVRRLLDSNTPTAELSASVAAHADLSPAERHSAYELLVPRLLDIERDAQRAVRELTGNATSTEDGRALVAAADMPSRVHHRAMELAEAWEYSPPEQTLTDETRRRRLAEADAILADLYATEVPPADWEQRIQDAMAARTEYLGRADPKTAQVRVRWCEAFAGDKRPLAMAEWQYRQAEYGGAITWLRDSQTGSIAPKWEHDPGALALFAMISWRQDRPESRLVAERCLAEARGLLDTQAGLENAMIEGTWSAYFDTGALLREATLLIQGSPAPLNPSP